MAIKLTTTRQSAAINGIKALVYGNAGAGKTTLCASLAEFSPVIISAESGLLSLRHVDIPVIEVSNIGDVQDAYRFLTESEEAKGFQTVCLDSLSEIAEVCLSAHKATTKDPRQAYGALQEDMIQLVRAFRDLPGRHVYMSAKMERTKDEATGSMIYAPAMPGAKLGQQIPYLFDEVFVLRNERDPDGNDARALQTVGDYQYSAKDRSGALDRYESPDLGAVIRKILAST